MKRIAICVLIVTLGLAGSAWAAFTWGPWGSLAEPATWFSGWTDGRGTRHVVRVHRGAYDFGSGTVDVSGEIQVGRPEAASNIILEVGEDQNGDRLIEATEWTFVTDALTAGSVTSNDDGSVARFDAVPVNADYAAYRVSSVVDYGTGTATYVNSVIQPGYDVE